MTVTQPAVTLLEPADLRDCQDLAADRDWPREDVKWRLLFAIGEPYGRPRGGFAGSVRGLGRHLTTHLLDEAGERTVFLHATIFFEHVRVFERGGVPAGDAVGSDHGTTALRAAVREAGIKPVRTVPLMVRGLSPGDAAMRFAPATQALG